MCAPDTHDLTWALQEGTGQGPSSHFAGGKAEARGGRERQEPEVSFIPRAEDGGGPPDEGGAVLTGRPRDGGRSPERRSRLGGTSGARTGLTVLGEPGGDRRWLEEGGNALCGGGPGPGAGHGPSAPSASRPRQALRPRGSVMHLSSEGSANEEREAGPPDGGASSGTDTTLFLPEQEIP